MGDKEESKISKNGCRHLWMAPLLKVYSISYICKIVSATAAASKSAMHSCLSAMLIISPALDIFGEHDGLGSNWK